LRRSPSPGRLPRRARRSLTLAPETFFVARNGKLVCERIQAGLHLDRNRGRFEDCVQELLGA